MNLYLFSPWHQREVLLNVNKLTRWRFLIQPCMLHLSRNHCISPLDTQCPYLREKEADLQEKQFFDFLLDNPFVSRLASIWLPSLSDAHPPQQVSDLHWPWALIFLPESFDGSQDLLCSIARAQVKDLCCSEGLTKHLHSLTAYVIWHLSLWWISLDVCIVSVCNRLYEFTCRVKALTLIYAIMPLVSWCKHLLSEEAYKLSQWLKGVLNTLHTCWLPSILPFLQFRSKRQRCRAQQGTWLGSVA